MILKVNIKINSLKDTFLKSKEFTTILRSLGISLSSASLLVDFFLLLLATSMY